ncbi:MAG: putative zinc-binding protein [Rikenellaceae bacterium]|nr:putative zinc-binding protein [Rikenellaceae bacterium]
MENKTCLCGSTEYIVFSCSGACDLGQITDIVARRLRDNKVRKMSCLATLGAGLGKPYDDLNKKNILILDGCPVDCGKKILENAGVTGYKYVRISDFGYKKGETPVNDGVISKVYGEVEVIF